jgi:hypothetical protein
VRSDEITRIVSIALSSFDAFLFDLDGVITRTAGLHASVWKTSSPKRS